MRLFVLVSGAGLLSGAAHSQQAAPVLLTAVDYKGSGVIVSAQNTGSCPYTVVLTCDLTHMQSSASLPLRQVLVPSKKKVVLTRLTPEPGQAYKYNYHYRTYLGNTTAPAPTPGYAYSLPFEVGREYVVMQGNNGTFSHANQQAVDFSMPENSVVCAARDGIVAELKQDSNGGCAEASCKEQGNYIIIFHDDGSYATYVHFRQNGSLVQLGQHVAKGQAIGYSGNTGWSSGPHLHFEVDVPGEPEKTSVPASFEVAGQTLSELRPGTRYKR